MSENPFEKYYKLKEQYEEITATQKKKFINDYIKKNGDASWKEKRRELKEFKPKCVNCDKRMGTIFKRQHDEKEETTFLIAMCGDRANPCNLNININAGNYFLIEDLLKIDEEDLQKLKNTVVKEKNDLLFGFITAEKAVENFDEVKENLNNINLNHQILYERYLNVSDNKEKKETLKRVEVEILALTDGIKELVKEYNKKKDAKYIKDAVDLQIKELNSLLKERMKLVYSYSAVEFMNVDKEQMCILVQKKITTKDLEENLG
jgi:hypothetical protein